MKKSLAAVCTVALALSAAAYAQDANPDETEGTEETKSGAVVTREKITQQGDPVLDENGVQKVDENGNPIFEEVETGFTQTVETPSGIVHTVTKEDGSRAVVTHDRTGHANAEKFARAERAERPAKPERAERPEKPERPERPSRPEKPERPGRP